MVIQDILANDTLNRLSVPFLQVNITQVSSTNNFVSVNATGSIVFKGSALSGTYNAEHQICQISNPSNCAFAVVTVGVTPNQIHAVKILPIPQMVLPQWLVLKDVLANDDLNGLPISLSQVSISQVSATSNYITEDNNGAVIFLCIQILCNIRYTFRIRSRLIW